MWVASDLPVHKVALTDVEQSVVVYLRLGKRAAFGHNR
jgi:hypothetical protein